MRIKYSILLIIFVALLSVDLFSQKYKADLIKWYIPTNIRLQFAGNIGMISVGPSWTLFNEKFELVYSLGYVPSFAARRNIYITAVKGFYKPGLEINIKELAFRPLSIGFVASYIFGDSYNKYRNKSLYPDNYFWWNPSFRAGLLYEAELFARIYKSHLKGLSAFLELSVWDLYIASKFFNHNNSYLNFWDITTLGFGIKLFFQ